MEMHPKDILRHLAGSPSDELFREADQVRKKFCGDEIQLRGLIEFSNHCCRDCLYCGLRKSNTRVHRYRMTPEEIFETAQKAKKLNFRTVVLQSGEDPDYGGQVLAALVKNIKTKLKLSVTLCVGERPREDYSRMKDAGADRYLLKFETSDPVLFRMLKPDSSYENRFRCLEDLADLNYQVGSGIMVGLPGQTLEILARDILLLKKLNLDMIGVGPFLPHPLTPLKDAEKPALAVVLKTVALVRILTKNSHMPATTAIGTLHPLGRQKALSCGANVLMPNLTPLKYRKDYQIYPNKICLTEEAETCQSCTRTMVLSLGRTIADHAGDSLKKPRRREKSKEKKP
jgi:biotin synthase